MGVKNKIKEKFVPDYRLSIVYVLSKTELMIIKGDVMTSYLT